MSSTDSLISKTVSHYRILEKLGGGGDPATIHSNCEDYRAAASIDMKHDQEDLARKISCPLLALWGERGALHRMFDVLASWRERATDVSGKPLPGRHFLPEEVPDETLAELRVFLNS